MHLWCRIGDETGSSLARRYDSRQLIEFLLLVGNYRMLSYVQNSVGIRPVTGTTPNIPGNRFLFSGVLTSPHRGAGLGVLAVPASHQGS